MHNIKTIAKFINNDNPDSSHQLITKTFGKYGVLDRAATAALDRKPRAGEFWTCEILLETRAGTPGGLFVLKPLQLVPKREGGRDHDIMYLAAGLYRTEKRDNVMLVTPDAELADQHWICSNTMRRHLMRRYASDDQYGVNAVIVVYGGDDWPKQTPAETQNKQ